MVSVGFVMLVRLVTVPALFFLACSSPIEPLSPGGGPGQRSSFTGAGESGACPVAAAAIVSKSPRPIAWILMMVGSFEGGQKGVPGTARSSGRCPPPIVGREPRRAL